MRVYGKVLGALLGWVLLRHPAGLVLGALLGHAFDAGWLGGRRAGGAASGPRAAEASDLAAARRVLGVAEDASDEEIERAFRKRISEYHPDKVAGAAEEIRSLAETRAREINRAYETLLAARRTPRR